DRAKTQCPRQTRRSAASSHLALGRSAPYLNGSRQQAKLPSCLIFVVVALARLLLRGSPQMFKQSHQRNRIIKLPIGANNIVQTPLGKTQLLFPPQSAFAQLDRTLPSGAKCVELNQTNSSKWFQ